MSPALVALPDPSVQQPLLLRPEQVAALLGVSRSKVYELISAGTLPGIIRIGRSTRVSRAALVAWVADLCAAEAGTS